MKRLRYANRVHCSVTSAKLCQCFPFGTVNSSLRCRSEPIARANGCAVVRTYTGHGINDLFHTAPNVPHYAKNKAVGTMKPGMVRKLATKFSALLTSSNLVLYNRTGKLPHVHLNDICIPEPNLMRGYNQMINLGSNWDTYHWPDNWTATTVDGKRSAQFEETLL